MVIVGSFGVKTGSKARGIRSARRVRKKKEKSVALTRALCAVMLDLRFGRNQLSLYKCLSRCRYVEQDT